MRKDLLSSFISPLRGRILCDYNNILVGNAGGVAIPTNSFSIDSLPNLTQGNTWVGNSSNRPVEQPYVGDATFVLRIPDANIPSAQALNAIALGILKVTNVPADGSLAQADAGTDYATTVQLTLLSSQIEAARAATEIAAETAVINEVAATTSALDAATNSVNAERKWHATEDYVYTIYHTGLNELPNHGNIDLAAYRVINLQQSPDGDFDAISFTFLRDLMNGNLQILFP